MIEPIPTLSNFPISWVSPKCETRTISSSHNGIFASAPIACGEIISIWGGVIMTRTQVEEMPPKYRHYATQVEEGFYLAGVSEDAADYFNHSCNPNAGMSGQITLVAMRPIAAGEEITFDYAMTDGTDYDEFECRCGAPNCRHHIRGTDWQNPELWTRYEGYFTPYLQRRINHLRNTGNEP